MNDALFVALFRMPCLQIKAARKGASRPGRLKSGRFIRNQRSHQQPGQAAPDLVASFNHAGLGGIDAVAACHSLSRQDHVCIAMRPRDRLRRECRQHADGGERDDGRSGFNIRDFLLVRRVTDDGLAGVFFRVISPRVSVVSSHNLDCYAARQSTPALRSRSASCLRA